MPTTVDRPTRSESCDRNVMSLSSGASNLMGQEYRTLNSQPSRPSSISNNSISCTDTELFTDIFPQTSGSSVPTPPSPTPPKKTSTLSFHTLKITTAPGIPLLSNSKHGKPPSTMPNANSATLYPPSSTTSNL